MQGVVRGQTPSTNGSNPAAAAAGFITRRGQQFIQPDGKPFYFIGGNAYWIIDKYLLVGLVLLPETSAHLHIPTEQSMHAETELLSMALVVQTCKVPSNILAC